MRGALLLLALAVLLRTAPAEAQAPPAAASATAPPAPPTPSAVPEPPPRPFSSGTHLGAYAAFAEIPGVLFGLNHEALILAAGFTFKYDGNGLTPPGGMRTKDTISASSLVSAAYLFYNRYPVGIGPALSYSTNFAPGAVFDQQLIAGSMAFYFAPFHAPVILVMVMSSRLVLAKGRDPVFDLVTPSVLVGYLIH
jgi:hypothetical protein